MACHELIERTGRRLGVFAAILVCAATWGATLAATWGAAAHDIPTDVKINAFIKPEGHKLELLIRVPLAAMIEVDFPTRGPGYLDISRADDALRNATKLYLIDNITLYEDGAPLPPPRITYARVSLASDRSFTSHEQARAHVEAPPLADSMDLYWNQQLLDVLLEYDIRSDRSAFSIRPRVDRFGQTVSTALRFLPPGGPTRAFEFHSDPGLVPLDPNWHQAAWRFVEFGILAHSRGHRPPAVPALSGGPVPAAAAAHSHRHVVHYRAFDLADRLRLRIRAGRAVVSAAH